MIERHFFKNKLVRTYDFEFGFCIPNSTNSWEAIYDVPPYSEAVLNDYVSGLVWEGMTSRERGNGTLLSPFSTRGVGVQRCTRGTLP